MRTTRQRASTTECLAERPWDPVKERRASGCGLQLPAPGSSSIEACDAARKRLLVRAKHQEQNTIKAGFPSFTLAAFKT